MPPAVFKTVVRRWFRRRGWVRFPCASARPPWGLAGSAWNTVIAAFAAATHGTYGNVDIGKGILIGIPAVGGVIVGTALQQRLSGRAVSLIFAALLVAVAIDLLVG